VTKECQDTAAACFGCARLLQKLSVAGVSNVVVPGGFCTIILEKQVAERRPLAATSTTSTVLGGAVVVTTAV